MFFQPFLLDANESNAYLATCSMTRKAILVDAGCYDPRISAALKLHDLVLEYIFLTHNHYDHSGGIGEIISQHGGLVLSAGRTRWKGKKVREGDEINIGRLRGRVIETGGHTNDSISLLLEERMVFVGDALFAGSIGGTSRARDQKREIENIRKKIFALDDEVEIYPGHGPPSLVGIERTRNPFFC